MGEHSCSGRSFNGIALPTRIRHSFLNGANVLRPTLLPCSFRAVSPSLPASLRQTAEEVGARAGNPRIYRFVRDTKLVSNHFGGNERIEQGFRKQSERRAVFEKSIRLFRFLSPVSRKAVSMRGVICAILFRIALQFSADGRTMDT